MTVDIIEEQLNYENLLNKCADVDFNIDITNRAEHFISFAGREELLAANNKIIEIARNCGFTINSINREYITNNPEETLIICQEGIKEIGRKIVNTIKELWRKLVDAITRFFKWIMSFFRSKKKEESIKEAGDVLNKTNPSDLDTKIEKMYEEGDPKTITNYDIDLLSELTCSQDDADFLNSWLKFNDNCMKHYEDIKNAKAENIANYYASFESLNHEALIESPALPINLINDLLIMCRKHDTKLRKYINYINLKREIIAQGYSVPNDIPLADIYIFKLVKNPTSMTSSVFGIIHNAADPTMLYTVFDLNNVKTSDILSSGVRPTKHPHIRAALPGILKQYKIILNIDRLINPPKKQMEIFIKDKLGNNIDTNTLPKPIRTNMFVVMRYFKYLMRSVISYDANIEILMEIIKK